MSNQAETIELAVSRITPWWLYGFLAAVALTVGAMAWTAHSVRTELSTLRAQQESQCVAPQAAAVPEPASPVPTEIVEPEPAPARQARRLVINAPVAASDTASTAWSEPTELDGALATFNRQLQEYGQ